MKFAIYSYVDLEYHQYVGLVQSGFDTVEDAQSFIAEFKAGNWRNSLLGELFVSTVLESHIDYCTEHFDQRYIYTDGEPPVKRDMEAEYKELVERYFPAPITDAIQKIDAIYKSFERFLAMDFQTARSTYRQYDETTFHAVNLVVPYLGDEGKIRYKSYVTDSSRTCSISGLGGSLYMDVKTHIDYIQNTNLVLMISTPENLIFQYNRAEYDSFDHFPTTIRIKASDENNDPSKIIDIEYDVYDEAQYFQHSLVNKLPPYQTVLQMYNTMKHINDNCPQVNMLQMNSKFLESELGKLVV